MDMFSGKIIIVSDTHGNISAIEKAVSQVPEAGMLLHAGDYAPDAAGAGLKIPFFAVRGNCDGLFSTYPEREVIDFGLMKLFLTHGHEQFVKSTLDNLVKEAIDRECSAAVFGHTHKYCFGNEGGVLLMNPGSLNAGRGTSSPGYIVLDVNGGDIENAGFFLL